MIGSHGGGQSSNSLDNRMYKLFDFGWNETYANVPSASGPSVHVYLRSGQIQSDHISQKERSNMACHFPSSSSVTTQYLTSSRPKGTRTHPPFSRERHACKPPLKQNMDHYCTSSQPCKNTNKKVIPPSSLSLQGCLPTAVLHRLCDKVPRSMARHPILRAMLSNPGGL